MSEHTANLDKIVETLSALTVLDMAKLKTLLEEKWGVKAQAAVAAVAVAPAQGGGGAAAAAEEATEFNVFLASVDPAKKMGLIKVIRELTGLGLKEAKDIVEGAPKEIKHGAGKAEAQDIKKKVEEAGGKVELKGV